MRRVLGPAVSGLVVVACFVGAPADGGRPGQLTALALSMVVAGSGYALRKRPAA